MKKIVVMAMLATALLLGTFAQAAEPVKPMVVTPAPMLVNPAVMAVNPPAMSAIAVTTPPATAPTKSGPNWPMIITAISMGLVAIIKILESLGIFKRVVKDPRWVMILNLTKKATEFFVKYADTTANTWDDALATILNDINAALLQVGEKPLTPEETDKAKAAATALKAVALPDAKPKA